MDPVGEYPPLPPTVIAELRLLTYLRWVCDELREESCEF